MSRENLGLEVKAREFRSLSNKSASPGSTNCWRQIRAVRVKKIEVATHPVTGLAGKLKDAHARTDGLYVGLGSWRIEFDGAGQIRFRDDGHVGAVEDRGIFLAACLLLAVTDIKDDAEILAKLARNSRRDRSLRAQCCQVSSRAQRAVEGDHGCPASRHIKT